MKKKTPLLLLLLLLLVTLPACGASESTQGKFGDTAAASQDNELDSKITELYAEEGSYQTTFGDELTYSYHVPQITASTADAVRLNTEIKETFGTKVAEALEAKSRGEDPIWLKVAWENHWDDQTLHLVLYNDNPGDNLDYAVYHFDFATGKILSNEEVLHKMGVTPEEALEAMRRTAVQTFDQAFVQSVPSSFAAECNQLRAQTLSPENLTITTAMFYPDGPDQITAILPIGSIAGAGWYYQTLSVPVKPSAAKPQVSSTSQCDFVKAVLEDDVTISFEKNPQAAWYETAESFRQAAGFQYDTPYTVENCYGDYTEIFTGVVGQDFFPYVFLLTQQGTVEYVNLFGGFADGILCNGGPLYGLGNIVRFESGQVTEPGGSGYQTVWAVDGEGTRHDVAEILYFIENGRSSGIAGNWETTVDQGEASCRLSLSLPEEDPVVFTQENLATGRVTTMTGSLTYIGMNEKGLLYAYTLYGEEGEHMGALALKPSLEALWVQLLSKDALWGDALKDSLTFTRIYN